LAVNTNAIDPTPVSLKRFSAALALAAVVATLGACHVPPPVTRSVLHITATGDMALDGKVLAPADLQAALAAGKAASSELEVEVRASPDANISLVQAAIEASRRAHVRVSFAREDGSQ
jgi:hypothetical protein